MSLDHFGMGETYFEPCSSSLVYILCDAVYLPRPEESIKVSKSFEKVVREYIQQHAHELNETTLKKAIDHAQSYYSKNYYAFEGQLKLALVIILQLPNGSANELNKNIFIASIGDIKIYKIEESFKLVYYDPEIPRLPENLTLKKRFSYMTNSIGALTPKVTVIRYEIEPTTTLLIATYGSYHQIEEDKPIGNLPDLEAKKIHLSKILSKSKEKEHFQCFGIISFENKTPLTHVSSLSSENIQEDDKSLRKELHFPTWAIKIGMAAILCLLCFELFNYYLKISKFSLYPHTTLHLIKEKDTTLNLKPLKRSLEFPFLKERAYISELKEKNIGHLQKIENLQKIINEQDKTLRELKKSKNPSSSRSELELDAYKKTSE